MLAARISRLTETGGEKRGEGGWLAGQGLGRGRLGRPGHRLVRGSPDTGGRERGRGCPGSAGHGVGRAQGWRKSARQCPPLVEAARVYETGQAAPAGAELLPKPPRRSAAKTTG